MREALEAETRGLDARRPEARPPRRPARPLLGVALALALGSMAGAAAARGDDGLARRVAGALTEGGAATAVVLGAALLAGGSGLRRDRPRALAPGSAIRIALLVALGLAAAGRAAGEAPREPGDASRAQEGRLRIARVDPRGVLVRLEGAPQAGWLRLPGALAREGERVRVLPGDAPSRPATGPAGGARPPPREVEPDELVRLAPAEGAGALLAGPLRALRAWARARLARLEDPRARRLASALVLGERDLDPELERALAHTGTLHLFVVSGLHVVLAAVLLGGPIGACAARLALLAGAGSSRAAWIADLARVAAIGLQCALAGGAPPVARAALAAALWTLVPRAGASFGSGLDARSPLRRADALSLWAFALSVELVDDPLAAAQAGVQLSYGATLALLVAAGPLARALDAGLGATLGQVVGRPGDGAFEPAASRAVALGRAALRPVRGALAASIAAVLGTLPIVWARFGRVAPLGVLGTLALLPAVLVALGLGWAALVHPALAPLPLQRFVGQSLDAGVHALDRLPGTPLALPERPLSLVLVASASALLALRLASRRDARARALARLAAVSFGLLLVPWSAAPRGLELVALDVGAGTAVLWRAPGAGAWIFDAGSRDRPGVAAAVERVLARWEVERLGVVVSHADRDHAGSLERVLAGRPPRLGLGAVPAHSDERQAHADGAKRPSAWTGPWLDLARGRLATRIGPGLELELWRGRDEAGNEGSRLVCLRWGTRNLWLSGDAEAEGLLELLALGALEGPAELLLWPHHGAETRAPGALLDRARPREVWISGSAPARIGPELERRGLAWRATSREGGLTLSLPPTGGEDAPVVRGGPPPEVSLELGPGTNRASGAPSPPTPARSIESRGPPVGPVSRSTLPPESGPASDRQDPP